MVSIKYGWRLKQIPSHCVYGNTFYLQYTLQYPKGQFATLHHNNIRKTTATLLTVNNKVYKEVHVEPQLQPLSGETSCEKTANKLDQARVDVS